ncbi:MAG: lipase family protein [Planctomycetaceae bacterium]
MQLIEDAGGDPRNAQFLCRACQLAYLPEAAGVKGFRDVLGLSAKLLSVDNTQVYVAESSDHLVVAFRGTEDPTSIEGLKDWLLTDAMNLLVVPEGRLGHDLSAAGVGAKFHKGFVDAIAEIWEPLRNEVEAKMKQSDRPLWITGHSLGGALALFAAWLLERRFVAVHQIYTFGAPMIGNQKASDAFNRKFSGKIFRYVSGRDPVPKLPGLSLVANEFAHVESACVLGTDPMTNLSQFVGAIGSQAVKGLIAGSLIDDVWKHVNEQVSAHFLDAYDGLLKK